MSTIIRSAREHPFVVLDKYGPNDPELSWKAKGLHTFILSKPDDWQIYVSELTKHAKDGKESTASGIQELIENGYIVRTRRHKPDGKFDGYDYRVYERPTTLVFVGDTVNFDTENGKPEDGKTVDGSTENGKPATTKERSKPKKDPTETGEKFSPPSTEEQIKNFKNLVYLLFLTKLTDRQISGAKYWAKWEAQKFYDHYSEAGWRTGRNKMKSWERAVANWFKTGLEKRRYKFTCPDDPAYDAKAAPAGSPGTSDVPVYDNSILDKVKIKKA